MRRVRKNDENHRSCEHVSFFLTFIEQEGIDVQIAELITDLIMGNAMQS